MNPTEDGLWARVGGAVAVLEGPEDIRMHDRETPAPDDFDVVVAVRAVGICGTDLHAYRGRQEHYPAILGHDLSGTVVAVGAQVPPDLLGRRVAVDPSLSCGRCVSCSRGARSECRGPTYLGMSAPGGMAEYLLTPATSLVPLPDSVSTVAATVLEPVAVSLRLLARVAGLLPEPGPAVILGGGPLGMVLAQVLHHHGWDPVLLEPRKERREVAAALGVRALPPQVMPAQSQPVLVVETSATSEGLALCLGNAPMGSVIALVGRAPSEISTARILLEEWTVMGVRGGAGQYPAAAALVESGAVRTEGLVTHRFPLANAAEAFRTATAANSPVVRAVLVTEGA